MNLVDQVLFVAALAALGGAGFRLASLAAPAGLERLVAATALAAAAAVAEALLLGRASLAGSPYALAGAAAATWLATHALVPAPELGARAELAAWRRSAGARPALAIVGAIAGLAAWALLHPFLGVDSITYHLSEAVTWAQRGTTGSIDPVVPCCAQVTASDRW